MNRQRGFSLLELLIVVGILLIIIGIAIPKLMQMLKSVSDVLALIR
ncbi:MAG: hypothetical protein DMG32_07605 [Acidobacteria bacterium]|nr:MAG: hypothetical protein DMG32_07605 [Acidobacteriota bacterium]